MVYSNFMKETHPDMTIALPGELDENPETLMAEDEEFQEWNNGRHEYVREALMADDFEW